MTTRELPVAYWRDRAIRLDRELCLERKSIVAFSEGAGLGLLNAGGWAWLNGGISYRSLLLAGSLFAAMAFVRGVIERGRLRALRDELEASPCRQAWKGAGR